MRFLSFLFLLNLSFLTSSVLSADNGTRKIIVFKESADIVATESSLRNLGIEVTKIKEIPFINAVVVNLSQNAEQILSTDPSVDFIENDGYINWLTSVTDNNFIESDIPQKQNEQSQLLPWGIDRIDAKQAWRVTKGQYVNVAVVDTGSGPHPDLKIWDGASMVDYTDSYNDDHFHGTHVAGIISAINNSVGVVGVAPQARLYAVKVLDEYGSGWLSDVIKGLEWCTKNNIQVINMSLGTYMNYRTFKLAIEATRKADIVQVAAAGNDYGGAVIYPAAYPQCIAVSATNNQDNIANFSSVGPEVDFSAPGENILSTIRKNDIAGYGILSGTSMASPHVAGVAALIMSLSNDPNGNGVWDPAEIRRRLTERAEDLGKVGKDKFFGHGIVDAEKSVE